MRTPNTVFTENRYHHEGLEQPTTSPEEASEPPSAPLPQHGGASLPQHGGAPLPQRGVPLANDGGDWEADTDPPAYPLPSGIPSHSASPNSARSHNQPPDGVPPDCSAEDDVIRVHMPQRLDCGPREAAEFRRSRRVRNLPSLSHAEPKARFSLMCGFLGTAMRALNNLEPFEMKSLAQAGQDYSWPKWKETMDVRRIPICYSLLIFARDCLPPLSCFIVSLARRHSCFIFPL
ncbi:hypothetical protein EJ06DRAFT_265647 [Trichodelitschia bisporula]|uniref:Uncharacterized protein n=1 Tax=Trichodelitschia bisporula TaxID=703511 RepID=A0A6G1HIB1_9PEZI|nr:hypothetical protein EJ06DRAFT_265647 [Trichodelitschia bisporula]